MSNILSLYSIVHKGILGKQEQESQSQFLSSCTLYATREDTHYTMVRALINYNCVISVKNMRYRKLG